MMRLNNKGITTIEVIICFVLVVTITTAMYGTVASYNQKRILEQYKEELYTYKNLITKEIQDDFIKIGLTHAEYKNEVDGYTTKHRVDCTLKDGTRRILIVTQTFGKSEYHQKGGNVNDYYMIQYGTSESDLIEYPLPNFGESKNDTGKTIKDLSINNVLIKVTADNVLDIYIGFYHPELTTRYGIQIITPIDYVATGNDSSSGLNLY